MKEQAIERGSSLDLPIVPSLCAAAAIVSGLVAAQGRPAMTAATLSYGCLLAGLLLRHTRKAHVTLMTTGIALDLAIVLTLEFQRHAVEKALEFSMLPLQQLHIGTSTVAVLLYIPVLAFGYQRLKGKGGIRARTLHLRYGTLAFIFRSLGFLLMFSLLWRPK